VGGVRPYRISTFWVALKVSALEMENKFNQRPGRQRKGELCPIEKKIKELKRIKVGGKKANLSLEPGANRSVWTNQIARKEVGRVDPINRSREEQLNHWTESFDGPLLRLYRVRCRAKIPFCKNTVTSGGEGGTENSREQFGMLNGS